MVGPRAAEILGSLLILTWLLGLDPAEQAASALSSSLNMVVDSLLRSRQILPGSQNAEPSFAESSARSQLPGGSFHNLSNGFPSLAALEDRGDPPGTRVSGS